MLRPGELMRLHVEALFTRDDRGDLVRVNEPAGAVAPRFFVGRTVDGAVLRFRHDVDPAIRSALAAMSDSAVESDPESMPNASQYEDILARSAPIEARWAGPVFRFPEQPPATTGAVLVTEANAALLHPLLDAWIPDVSWCRPMFAFVVEGVAVSVCASVRRTDDAHEAGVDTAPTHRGRGYAGWVVAEWARAVRDSGCVPLYSTSWQNTASQRLAQKLGLIRFGDDLHIR